MRESWKILKGFTRYKISNYGRVRVCRALDKNYRYMTIRHDKGVLYTILKNDQGKRKNLYIARTVLKYFGEDIDETKYIAAYKDNNKANCKIDNLYWKSKSEQSLEQYSNKPSPTLKYNRIGIFIGNNLIKTYTHINNLVKDLKNAGYSVSYKNVSRDIRMNRKLLNTFHVKRVYQYQMADYLYNTPDFKSMIEHNKIKKDKKSYNRPEPKEETQSRQKMTHEEIIALRKVKDHEIFIKEMKRRLHIE